MDVIFSVVMLASFIWVVRVLLPKAIKEQSGLALASAVLAAVLALVGWLLIGVGVRSTSESEAGTRDRSCRSSIQRVTARCQEIPH